MPLPTLWLWPESVDPLTGQVVFNGIETGPTSQPFEWDFGDGETTAGYFPQEHTYSDLTHNYVATVTSHYAGGEQNSVSTLVKFAAPAIEPVELSWRYHLDIPQEEPELTPRFPGYWVPETIVGLADADLGLTGREALQYVLRAGLAVQGDMAGDNLESGFTQMLVMDTAYMGDAYSLWGADTPSAVVAPWYLSDLVPYSPIFNATAHNLAMNGPSGYCYGGRVDGPAGPIFEQSVSAILQHACLYQLINSAPLYGLGPDLVQELCQSATAEVQYLRNAYDDYVGRGMHFRTWEIPGDPWAYLTASAVAFKFCEHAENAGIGYRTPAKRMMSLLHQFDSDMAARYDQSNDSPAADEFRATLMVAALSYAFDTDLRGEFRSLNFPVSDLVWCDLQARMAAPQPAAEAKLLPSGSPVSIDGLVVTHAWPNYFYAETPERTCGIRVIKNDHGLWPGEVVQVRGIALTDENQERFVLASYAGSSESVDELAPLVMTERSMGGGPFFYDAGTVSGQAGVSGGHGLNNIGLYIKLAGVVTAVDAAGGWFTVWDGSGVSDPDGNAGVRVLTEGLEPPAPGEVVSVRGASSCIKPDGNIYPLLRVSKQEDIEQ